MSELLELFGILESYNLDARTFFTPVGELRVTYHEMHYVTGLPYGEFSYEERFPTSHELGQIERLLPAGASLYREVLYHFNICMNLHEQQKISLSFAKWAKYLVSDLRSPKKLKASSLSEVEVRVEAKYLVSDMRSPKKLKASCNAPCPVKG